MFEEAFQIAEERREANGKGEREIYTKLNAAFQRRARRDKKSLSEQYKEIEENKKPCLKLNVKKTEIMASGSITLGQIEG